MLAEVVVSQRPTERSACRRSASQLAAEREHIEHELLFAEAGPLNRRAHHECGSRRVEHQPNHHQGGPTHLRGTPPAAPHGAKHVSFTPAAGSTHGLGPAHNSRSRRAVWQCRTTRREQSFTHTARTRVRPPPRWSNSFSKKDHPVWALAHHEREASSRSSTLPLSRTQVEPPPRWSNSFSRETHLPGGKRLHRAQPFGATANQNDHLSSEGGPYHPSFSRVMGPGSAPPARANDKRVISSSDDVRPNEIIARPPVMASITMGAD